MLNWFKKKDLNDYLNETKVVKIKGVAFRIRRISPIDYMSGYNVLYQSYELYKTKGESSSEINESHIKKMREMMSHAIVAGVVAPKLSIVEKEGHILVDKIFADFEMGNELFQSIIEYGYGKKKLSRLQLFVQRLSK